MCSCSAPLTRCEELSWRGSLLATLLSGKLVGVCVPVVVVHVLWHVLTSTASLWAHTSVLDEVVSDFSSVSEQDIDTVLVAEPSCDSCFEKTRLSCGMLMHPMCIIALEFWCPGGDLSWELVLESWHHIIESQSVC